MRPRTLSFSGLRSYRVKTTVSFDGHDLFAIIGDTGAGKSTVLEALCFALYGRKTWSGGSKQDLIADGCDRLIVELDFDADGQPWKVTRSRARSAGSNVDKLVAVGGHAPSIDGHSEVKSRVEDLVGLDFEQFTRAVVLPQGRFDELLRSTETERNRILKSVLGLSDIAKVADEIRSIREDTKGLRERYLERRRRYPDDPSTVLDEATASVANASKRLECLETAVQAISEPRRLIGGSAPVAALTEALAAVPDLDHDVPAILRASLNRGRELSDDDAKLTDAIETAGAAIAEVDAEIEMALAGFDDRDALKLAATEADEAASQLPEAAERRTEAHTRRSDLDTVAPAADVDPALAAAVETARNELAQRRDELDDAKGQESKALTQADQLIKARARLPELARAIEEKVSQIGRAEAERHETAEAHRHAKELLEQAEAAEKEAHRADAAASAAVGHQPGDDCPVCAQRLPHDFEAPRSADIQSAEQARNSARQSAEKAHSVASKAAQLAASLGQAADQARQAHDDHLEELQRYESLVVDSGADPSATAAEDIVAVLTARAAELAQGVLQAESELESARERLSAATAEHAAAVAQHEGHIQAADQALKQAQLDVTRLTADLVAKWPASWAPSGDVTPEALTKTADRLNSAIDRFDRLNSDRSRAEKAKADAERDRSDLRATLTEQVTAPARDAIVGINSYLGRVADVQSKTSAAATIVDLQVAPSYELGAIALDVSTEQLPTAIQTLEARLASASAVVANATSTLEATVTAITTAQQQIDQTLREVECESIDSLIGAQGKAREAVATAEKERAVAEADVLAAAKVDEILGVVIPFADNLDVLVEALRDKQFVDHLLERREAELLAEAARRLKTISNSRFVFVSDFGIKNTASGEIRSADSLSGGERFQASLALALALVEIASRGGGRLDAVFVDEGFGSLDANSLDTALETLGRIAGAGKMVALISHLRSVADYVDTVMHVTRDDATGSRIRTLSAEERDALLADDIRSGLTG